MLKHLFIWFLMYIKFWFYDVRTNKNIIKKTIERQNNENSKKIVEK